MALSVLSCRGRGRRRRFPALPERSCLRSSMSAWIVAAPAAIASRRSALRRLRCVSQGWCPVIRLILRGSGDQRASSPRPPRRSGPPWLGWWHRVVVAARALEMRLDGFAQQLDDFGARVRRRDAAEGDRSIGRVVVGSSLSTDDTYLTESDRPSCEWDPRRTRRSVSGSGFW